MADTTDRHLRSFLIRLTVLTVLCTVALNTGGLILAYTLYRLI